MTPALLRGRQEFVSIVVDVLRASSTCVAMFDSGIEAIAIAANPEAARTLRAAMPGALLCGEVGGLPPDGFDYGNSPIEFSRLNLRSRRAIVATSNGTRALHAVSGAPAVLVGCLLNCAAVAEVAVAEARRAAAGIQIVCAGNDYGATFSLDDFLTAGAIVSSAVKRLQLEGTDPVELSDAALAACRLFDSYGGVAASAFREGMHGRSLERLGFSGDLDFCAAIDRSDSVPYLAIDSDGLLVLRRRT